MGVKKISFIRPNILEEIPDIEDYNLDAFVEVVYNINIYLSIG